MRVMMPNYTIMTVEKTIAVSELRLKFNGRDVRLCECATDIVYANAIAFFPETNSMTTGGAVLLGNLSNEFVREALASLVRDGHIDLTGLKLQGTQPLVSSYVVDNGVSGAYMLKGYEVNMCCAHELGYPFMGGAIPAVSEAEDVDDAGEEEDDG